MNMADTPNPARAAGTATPKRPPKAAAPSLRDRVLKRQRDDLDEAVPTTLRGKVRQADKYGEGSFKQVTPGKRQMLLDERDKRQKRDNALIDAYKNDAQRARSFMSEYSNPLVKKAKAGKISEYGGKEKYTSKKAMAKHERAETPAKERMEKMAMGGMCRGMGAATRGGNYKG